MNDAPPEAGFDTMNRKDIILAGGAGTRLHPATLSISKQLHATLAGLVVN